MYVLAVGGRQDNVNKVGEQQHWLVAVVAPLGGALTLVAARQWRPLERRQWLGGGLLGQRRLGGSARVVGSAAAGRHLGQEQDGTW